MRIAILSKKGIDELTAERLYEMYPHEAFRRCAYARRGLDETTDARILPLVARYVLQAENSNHEISILGPSHDVPNYLIANGLDELNSYKRKLEETPQDESCPIIPIQDQFIVLDGSIYLREFNVCGSVKQEKFHLLLSNRSYLSVSTNDRILWEKIISAMMDQFLSSERRREFPSHKIIYETVEDSRTIETLLVEKGAQLLK